MQRRTLLPLLAALPLAAQQKAPVPPAPVPFAPLLTTQQSVTVTAERGLAGLVDLSTSTATLDPQQLGQAPGLALDDRLHQVAGFTLFRRTSSWTANPTTQGISLRGLGSTAASRTLVVSDQVPQNDPFGGWIHWNEIPALAIGGGSRVRGGAADLYGSSAIGGVIDIAPAVVARAALASRATPIYTLSADTSGATENSALGDAALTAANRRLQGLAALSVLSTGGYIATAPASRGLVDVPSNVVSESARGELRGLLDAAGDAAFLRGNLLNEARSNGTPLTTNGTRLWRYQAGGDAVRGLTTASLRLFGSRETYRQSFSSVATGRNSETLTRLQQVPTDELGFSLQAARQLRETLTAALGLDLRDIRATDDETPVSNGAPGTTASTDAHQRDVGGFAVANWRPEFHAGVFSATGSIRADSFRTFDAQQTSSNRAVATTPFPQENELFASPHLGLVYRLSAPHVPTGTGLTANGFRAFRGPTLNELYRTGQVAAQTTLANPALLAERATGYEFGGYTSVPRFATVRATYFWTVVNRPISAVLLSQTGAAQTLQRQNLGQIRSRGLSVEAATPSLRGFTATASYQLAFATVTRFNTASAAQPPLVGKLIPQVPRQAITATANYGVRRLAAFHAIASYTGLQYDDAANQFALHPYARFDVSADRPLTRGLSVFGSVQNLLNRSIDAGRTPLLTLASPRLVQAGLRFTFAR